MNIVEIELIAQNTIAVLFELCVAYDPLLNVFIFTCNMLL